MSDLDDRLREILQAVWKEDNQYFAIEAGSYDSDGNFKEAAELIKQAFADEGKFYGAGEFTFAEKCMREGYMTGVDWYDRFLKELGEHEGHWGPMGDPIVLVEYAEAAARKAAGL